MDSDPISALVGLLRERHGALRGCYLFGSRADSSARPDSDWDFGLLCPDLDALKLRDTAAQASILLGADVDLVDLRRASTVLKAEILRRGRAVFAADPAGMARFEMDVLTEYQNLNESRKFILRDFGMAA